jgi:hypothetical protein
MPCISVLACLAAYITDLQPLVEGSSVGNEDEGDLGIDELSDGGEREDGEEEEGLLSTHASEPAGSPAGVDGAVLGVKEWM